jgi:hypothetical protein
MPKLLIHAGYPKAASTTLQNKLFMVSEDATHQTKASSRRAEFYTSKLYNLVYDLYRKDFEAFGYERIRA